MRLIISVCVALLFQACHKAKTASSEEHFFCHTTCRNSGTCDGDDCNCTEDWKGAHCDTFYTAGYNGVYTSNDLDCGGGKGSATYTVTLDSFDKTHLKVSSLDAHLVAHGQFTFQQSNPTVVGTGTIDGKSLLMHYSVNVSTVTLNCAGSFKRL